MAKQRKQKQKEHRLSDVGVIKSDEGVASSCSTILHQKLCVAVDLAAQRIYGHTELKVAARQGGKVGGVIGLHARDLHIEQVLVDGVEARFEIHNQLSPYEANSNHPAPYTKSHLEAADDAYRKYSGDLYGESDPELHIFPPASPTPTDPGQEVTTTPEVKTEVGLENGFSQSAPDTKSEASALGSQSEEVKIVRVEYWVENPSSGAHFQGDILHTNNQLRRARCWFPCVDSPSQRCSFDLEFTVHSEYVAVSNGTLLHKVYSKEGTHLKTFVYSFDFPITASSVSLVVAPLVVLPDQHHANVTHLCLPGMEAAFNATISSFHTVFSLYQEYLGAGFPFPCYQQVFLPGSAVITTSSIGASVATFSADLLADENIIDQAIGTRIKLAHALAQQWFGIYISPDSPADDWLLEGLAGLLTDHFVKRFLGNNEARFRRYKANEAVCLVEVDGAPVLSPPAGLDIDMCGTENLGVLGKVRSWKATAVVQMLEKQMGPEPFKKVLQRIIMRAADPSRKNRTLSTTEFRHFAIKIGNLERPFLKDFFPRWVESSGCPRLRMGFIYSKRRNMVELAVRRESTAVPRHVGVTGKAETPESKLRDSDMGWPGMMSIRLHELDGMYDHPSLPMAGDCYQLLELQCHSKLAGRRIQRPKKGAKGEVEENVDATPAQSLESPLLWIRGDPELEYLAELHLLQPEHMWINQLEKDRDVIGQVQAVTALRAHSRTSFALVNALSNCLNDPKVFCRVRIEAATALASTASEGTSYMGLQNLIKYYKSRCFDPDIGLPKPNDFHDFSEYFVLEAIPGAVAEVRGTDGKSPLEATDFILHILKHNDNNGNAYSDVFWLASVIESVGTLEFGQQTLKTLARMLKQIDRFLQYNRLMPTYNGVVTISCIHTLAKIAIRFSHALSTERIKDLLKPFKEKSVKWQVRVAALKALLDVEFHSNGLEAAVILALQFIHDDESFAVQSKVMKHVVHQGSLTEKCNSRIGGITIARLLALLESSKAFHNILLRHNIFSFLQVLAGRSASLYRSADCLSKLGSHHLSQAQRFGKIKNSFKLRLRPTQPPAPAPSPPPAPQSELPWTIKFVHQSGSREIAERAESPPAPQSEPPRTIKIVRQSVSREIAERPESPPAPQSEPKTIKWVDPSVSRENAEKAESPPAPQSEPRTIKWKRSSVSRENAERTESGSSEGRREVDEQKFRIVLKMPKDYKSSSVTAGDETNQAVEVSTGAVPTEHQVVNSPPSVQEGANLHEVIDSNPFTQLIPSLIEPEESQALHANYVDSVAEDNITQENMRPEIGQFMERQNTEELNQEDREGDSPRGLFHQTNIHQGSDSRASTEQEPPFDLYGEDTLDGMGESRDDSRKAGFGVSQAGSELQRFNSLSGMMGTENSTQDGADTTQDLATQENESQKKQSGDKKERRHDKKDKKDRKERKKDRKERKHDKHNDPEYLEKKRKRKEEREQRHRQEGHKSSKEEHRKEERTSTLEEKPDALMNEYSQPESTRVESQGGTDIMRIKVKFKKPRTTA